MFRLQQCTLLEVTGGLSSAEIQKTGEPFPVYWQLKASDSEVQTVFINREKSWRGGEDNMALLSHSHYL